MEYPFFTLVLLYFGVVFGLVSLSVYSQQDLQQSPPPPPPSPSPAPPSPPPPPRSPSPPPPPRYPPPPRKARHPPGSRNTIGSKSRHKKRYPPPPPPRRKKNLNLGKKLGFIFAGLAAILQICVVAFLVIKRRHLIKTHDRY